MSGDLNVILILKKMRGAVKKKHPVVSHFFDTSKLSDKIAITILYETFPPGHLPAGAPPPPAEYLYID